MTVEPLLWLMLGLQWVRDQINLDAADVLIPGDDPGAVVELTKLARSARRIVQVNILLSVLLTILWLYAYCWV